MEACLEKAIAGTKMAISVLALADKDDKENKEAMHMSDDGETQLQDFDEHGNPLLLDAPLIDLKQVARSFITQRLRNTSTVEDIRAKALGKLSAKLDDPEQRFSTNGLLEIIDTLNNSSKEDMNAIMKAQTDASAPGKNSSGSYYNIFVGNENNAPSSALPAQSFMLLEKLVTAASAIVNNKK